MSQQTVVYFDYKPCPCGSSHVIISVDGVTCGECGRLTERRSGIHADPEARALAEARAERTGARQTRPRIYSPEVARRMVTTSDPTYLLDEPDPLAPDVPGDPGTISDWRDRWRRIDTHRDLTMAAPLPRYGFAVDASKLRDAMAKVGAAFALPAGRLADLSRALILLSEADGEAPDNPTAKRRHGHAATCPRHGPTRGGLCRRCAR